MNANTSYIRYTWFILVMVFLVIAAGGVVRMTQSGMGCPDWPTCFGRWVPPTSADQLPPDFEKYLKQQDIDHSFNVYHTWIEYINRLLGALLGFFILIHFIWSVRKFWTTEKKVVLLSLLLLLGVGFQGWLGKKVVDANLAVVKITVHMLMALVLAAIPLLILTRLKAEQRVKNSFLKIFTTIVLFILVVQVVLGTQVREQIDEIAKPLKYAQRETWIGQLDNIFFIHRSFSWLALGACFILAWRAWKYPTLRNPGILALLSAIMASLLGIIMAWYSIPALAQPLHLLAASILIMTVFTLRLRLR